jgi:hypothetical protein
VAVAVVVMLAAMACGCDGKLGKEFRETASSSLQSGLTEIATGLINGAFAVYDPDTTATDDTTSN